MTTYTVECEGVHIFTTPIMDQATEGARAMAHLRGIEVYVTQHKDDRTRCVGYMPDGTINKYWEVQS